MTNEAVGAIVQKLLATELEGNRATQNYRKEVLRNAGYFFTWMKNNGYENIRELGKAELFEYYRYTCAQRTTTGTRIKGGLISRRTINGRLSAVRKVFTALYRMGFLDDDPLHGFSLGVPPDRALKRRPFTEQEITDFLEQIDPSSPRGLRDRALFELIYSSGLRVAEAARLKIGDIDLGRREIIVRGKLQRDRLVPISVVARDFLQQYLGPRLNRLEEAVFRGSRAWVDEKAMRPQEITRRFRTLLLRFDMDRPGRCAHAVRHSTATHLLDHGASIRHVQELLGHKNIENTARYTHVQTDGLAKIYRKYHPGEHELYEELDEEYLRRLDTLLAEMKKQ